MILTHSTNIVYYNNNIINAKACANFVGDVINATFSFPATWHDLLATLEQGCDFLAFHEDMIAESKHSTPIEFIDTIISIAKLLSPSRDLKIAVVITTHTTLASIRTLQKTPVQGIILDANFFASDAVHTSVNAFINKIPYWPSSVIEKLPGSTNTKVCNISLTSRQSQVFRMIVERGSCNKVIAKSLGISESTVKLHLTEIFKKYGVRSRTQLAVFGNTAEAQATHSPTKIASV